MNKASDQNISMAHVKTDSKIRPSTKKRIRKRWSEDEKKIVLHYFKKHLKTKTTPKKDECLALINAHSDLFQKCDWVRIKALNI